MKCHICSRDNLTQKELAIHIKYFHNTAHQQPQKIAQGVCPDCGSTLWFEEGCTQCKVCGYSRCM